MLVNVMQLVLVGQFYYWTQSAAVSPSSSLRAVGLYALIISWLLIAFDASRSGSDLLHRKILRLAVTVALGFALLWYTGIGFWERPRGTWDDLVIPLRFFGVGLLVVLAEHYASEPLKSIRRVVARARQH
jgi:hypothetical protein